MPFRLPLTVDLQPSRLARHWAIIAHGLVFAAVLFLNFPPWYLAAYTLVILASLWWCWRKIPMPSVETLECREDGSIAWVVDGDQRVGHIQANTLIHPVITAVTLKGVEGEVVRVVLWPDSAPAEQLRQLRVWLRWGEAASLS